MSIEQVLKKQPKKVKKRRRIKLAETNELGEEIVEEGGWEEFYDYIFPEDKSEGPNFTKILSIASKWKKGES